MIRIWLLWLKVLWRSEHIWAFYVGLFILYLSKYVFFIDELPVIIPLYGLFMSTLTLVFLNLPKRYHIGNVIRITNCYPIRSTFQLWLFSLLCTLPASALLFVTVSEIFTDTPAYLLMLVTFGLSYFAINFAFVCSLLPFKTAMMCCVIVYFILVLMHGYRLETVRYVAPTLNFMYPDYPDVVNILSILFLGILMVGIYLWKGIDWPHRHKKRLLLINFIMLSIFVAVPVGQLWYENHLVNQPYQQFQVNNVVVQYKGISYHIANRYSQVVSDILDELLKNKLNLDITQIRITRLNHIPKGDHIEHILKLDGTTLYVEPYSNKFYEFNYGYNIIRDMLELSGTDHQVQSKITQNLILENKHHFFDALQRRVLKQSVE